MAIIQATDDALRQIIHEHRLVLVKFVDDDCNVCKMLAPKLEALSEEPRYKRILFLRMDATINPVSAREVRFTKAPFFAGYVDGVLQECGVVATQEGVEQLLRKMLAK